MLLLPGELRIQKLQERELHGVDRFFSSNCHGHAEEKRQYWSESVCTPSERCQGSLRACNAFVLRTVREGQAGENGLARTRDSASENGLEIL
jgi:hypothetical protein